jgi:glycosyltransferase involved in cell wall biosynthesis
MVTLLRLLQEVGQQVVFTSLRPWPVELIGTEERLAQLGVEIAARDGAIGSWLRAHGRDLDLVVASRLTVAEVMLPLVRRHCPNARFVYDATHVEHLARYRLAKLTGNRPLLVTALRDRSAERDVVAAADAVIATSDEDADYFRQLVTDAAVHVVPAVEARGDRDDMATGIRAGIVFLGFLGVVENEMAVRRLIEKVWPLIEAELEPTSLTVVGAAPPQWLRTVSESHPRLIVTGHVPVIDEILREAAVTVVPLSGGAGVKTKVLQAFANGLPVVATAAGMRGVPAVDGVHALLAESDDELAAAAVRILRDPDLGRSLASRASTLLREKFTDDVYRVALQKALAVPKRVCGD